MKEEQKNLSSGKLQTEARMNTSSFNYFFTNRTPEKGSKKIFSKLRGKRSSAPGGLLRQSQSWDSSLSRMTSTPNVDTTNWRVDEERLPEPPPLPTVDYLLGKRPANLRGKTSTTLKEEVKEKAAAIKQDSDDGTVTYIDSDNDSDSHSSHSSHSSVSSTHSDRKHKKKKKRKKKGQKGETTDVSIQWTYNKLTVPQSSPPRERNFFPNERMPTPIPNTFTGGNLPTPRKLDFDMKQVASPPSQSPSSLSPLSSLSPRSPISPVSSQEVSPARRPGGEELTGYLKPSRVAPPPPANKSNLANRTAQTNRTSAKQGSAKTTAVQPSTSPRKTTTGTQPKRAAPKLPPNVQNRQKQIANTGVLKSPPPNQTRASPISKISSSRKSQGRAATKSATAKVTGQQPSNRSPNEFMAALNQAVASSPGKPSIVQQMGRNGGRSPSSSPGTHSPTIDEIELQLDAMKSTLAGAALQPMWLLQRPPSPERGDSGTDSSESTSSSDDSSSDSDTSSDDSSDDDDMVAPKRPIMARNPSMESGKGYGGFNRARLLARYPRLLRKRVVRLPTIDEVPEEIIYTTVSGKLILY